MSSAETALVLLPVAAAVMAVWQASPPPFATVTAVGGVAADVLSLTADLAGLERVAGGGVASDMFYTLLTSDLSEDQASRTTVLAGMFSTVAEAELQNCAVCAVLTQQLYPTAARKRRSWDAMVHTATRDITSILTQEQALRLFTNIMTLLVARVAEMDADMAECSTVIDEVYDTDGLPSRVTVGSPSPGEFVVGTPRIPLLMAINATDLVFMQEIGACMQRIAEQGAGWKRKILLEDLRHVSTATREDVAALMKLKLMTQQAHSGSAVATRIKGMSFRGASRAMDEYHRVMTGACVLRESKAAALRMETSGFVRSAGLVQCGAPVDWITPAAIEAAIQDLGCDGGSAQPCMVVDDIVWTALVHGVEPDRVPLTPGEGVAATYDMGGVLVPVVTAVPFDERYFDGAAGDGAWALARRLHPEFDGMTLREVVFCFTGALSAHDQAVYAALSGTGGDRGKAARVMAALSCPRHGASSRCLAGLQVECLSGLEEDVTITDVLLTAYLRSEARRVLLTPMADPPYAIPLTDAAFERRVRAVVEGLQTSFNHMMEDEASGVAVPALQAVETRGGRQRRPGLVRLPGSDEGCSKATILIGFGRSTLQANVIRRDEGGRLYSSQASARFSAHSAVELTFHPPEDGTQGTYVASAWNHRERRARWPGLEDVKAAVFGDYDYDRHVLGRGEGVVD